METISIIPIEQAINHCLRVQPPVDYVLGADLRILATPWGEMIYRHLESLQRDALAPATRIVVERWLVPVAGATPTPCNGPKTADR